MKKQLTVFLLMLSILLCGCTKDLPDESNLSSDTDPINTVETFSSDGQTEKIEPWQPDLTKNWNFSLVPRENADLPEDYDLALSLDVHTFSISEIPEKINLKIVNQTDKPFYMCTTVHLEKLYDASMKFEDEHIDIAYTMGKGWIKLPFTTNEKVSWGTTMRADLTYPISLEENMKENCEFTPGKYRFVCYSAVGPHYAYFEITE